MEDTMSKYSAIIIFLAIATLLTGQVKYSDSLLRTAQNGDPEAQFQIGVCFKDGLGVKANKAEAVAWYSKASAKGHPGAQHNLAYCYYVGDGVAVDKK